MINKLVLLSTSLLFITSSFSIPLEKRELQHPYNTEFSFEATGAFNGIATFAHLPYERCLENPNQNYDIAVVGIPFDTATSYRPGARFGPAGIREGSRMSVVAGSFSTSLNHDPYKSGNHLIDCGDIPVTPFDNKRAIKQMYDGYLSLLNRTIPTTSTSGNGFPRLLTLGGDHTIVLPILRAIHKLHGPVSVIHFDSHIDTWAPFKLGKDNNNDNNNDDDDETIGNLNHGTYFYFASKEGLINKDESVHVGIRSHLGSPQDYIDDRNVGFDLIEANEIDTIGTKGIVDRIRQIVGDNYVYLSLDIDVLDPAFASGTGTPVTGGFTTRELHHIIKGLDGLNIIGADVVEVAPAYDHNGQVTSLAAANILFDILTIMTKKPIH
ncbi:unnamed protein product [Cunninghamella blakesleeana]